MGAPWKAWYSCPVFICQQLGLFPFVDSVGRGGRDVTESGRRGLISSSLADGFSRDDDDCFEG